MSSVLLNFTTVFICKFCVWFGIIKIRWKLFDSTQNHNGRVCVLHYRLMCFSHVALLLLSHDDDDLSACVIDTIHTTFKTVASLFQVNVNNISWKEYFGPEQQKRILRCEGLSWVKGSVHPKWKFLLFLKTKLRKEYCYFLVIWNREFLGCFNPLFEIKLCKIWIKSAVGL